MLFAEFSSQGVRSTPTSGDHIHTFPLSHLNETTFVSQQISQPFFQSRHHKRSHCIKRTARELLIQADGTRVAHFGSKLLSMGVGTPKIEGRFDVRNVTKPIVAAGQLTDRGQGLWLNGDGGFILEVRTSLRTLISQFPCRKTLGATKPSDLLGCRYSREREQVRIFNRPFEQFARCDRCSPGTNDQCKRRNIVDWCCSKRVENTTT